jgi:radical SAM protein (TIGR01212 family)
MTKKWKDGKYIVYFSSFTNTYGPIGKLRKLFFEAIKLDSNIVGINIATRPDCVNDEILSLLRELNLECKVTIELGVQTFDDFVASSFNRGYKSEIIYGVIDKLNDLGIEVIIHLINGLPWESVDSMINNAKIVGGLKVKGVKFHMLQVVRNSALGAQYIKHPFNILKIEEYVELVSKQIRYLRKDIIIHRISGDGKIDDLLAPTWSTRKLVVINEIDKYMRANKYFQGDLFIK